MLFEGNPALCWYKVNVDPLKTERPLFVATAALEFGILSKSLCVFEASPDVLNDLNAVADVPL